MYEYSAMILIIHLSFFKFCALLLQNGCLLERWDYLQSRHLLRVENIKSLGLDCFMIDLVRIQ